MHSNIAGVKMSKKLVVTMLICICASSVIAVPLEYGRAKASACASCHGVQGVSKDTSIPNLRGKAKAYIVKALKEYRSGVRENYTMQHMARHLADSDIDHLATYYSSLKIGVDIPAEIFEPEEDSCE